MRPAFKIRHLHTQRIMRTPFVDKLPAEIFAQQIAPITLEQFEVIAVDLDDPRCECGNRTGTNFVSRCCGVDVDPDRQRCPACLEAIAPAPVCADCGLQRYGAR